VVRSDRDPVVSGLEGALRDASQAEDRADYETAIQALTRAVELAGTMAPPQVILDLRSRIAWCASLAGRFDDAVAVYRDVLSQREQVLGRAHPDVTRTLLSLASAEANRWSLTEAEMLYLSVASRLASADVEGRLEVASGLAALYLRQGRPAQALKECQEALSLVDGSGHVDAVVDLEDTMAMALAELGHPAEARAILERLIRQSAPASNPVKYVRSMVTYGNLLADSEQLAEAQEILERTFNTARQALGDHHPDTAYAQQCLGIVHARRNRYDEAEKFLRGAIRIWGSTQAVKSILAAEGLYSLAILRGYRRDFREARRLLRSALDIQAAALPPGDARLEATRHALAQIPRGK
jgi:tetratricopeptide (TPR) repeat protein